MLCNFVFIGTGHVCVNCGRSVPVPEGSRIVAACLGKPSGCLAGTALKSLLSCWPFRIVATADCKCTSRAAYMDAKGCDWCESPEGMAEILGFLREAAEERGLPFVDIAARLLVRRAIANARKAEAASARGSQRHD
jgi:hypothetical protein